jgi:hypothetical protein
MTLNAGVGRADAADIVRLVRDNGVSLLAVQELSPALERRLDAEGLGGLLPNRISHSLGGASGGGVYSNRPLAPLASVAGSAFHIPTLQVTLAAGGRPVHLAVTNVHTQAPVEDETPRWRSDLTLLGSVAARPGNVLLLGDFNATFDHAEFRRMLAGGPDTAAGTGSLVDAGVAALARFAPTWPKDGQWLPGVVIDHIVASPRLRSSGYSVQTVAGTDHAAVLATLSVPAGG